MNAPIAKKRPRAADESGFTLLEVLIAFALITVVAASVYIMQSNSLFSSLRTKNMLIASNLARSFLTKSELELEAKEFTLLKETEEGKFPEPYEHFKWKREVKEQDFSSLANIVQEASKALQDDKNGEPKEENQDGQMIVLKIFQNYLKDSIRRLKVTITWPEDGKDKSISFSTLLVRYDAQFRTAL